MLRREREEVAEQSASGEERNKTHNIWSLVSYLRFYFFFCCCCYFSLLQKNEHGRFIDIVEAAGMGPCWSSAESWSRIFCCCQKNCAAMKLNFNSKSFLPPGPKLKEIKICSRSEMRLSWNENWIAHIKLILIPFLSSSWSEFFRICTHDSLTTLS